MSQEIKVQPIRKLPPLLSQVPLAASIRAKITDLGPWFRELHLSPSLQTAEIHPHTHAQSENSEILGLKNFSINSLHRTIITGHVVNEQALRILKETFLTFSHSSKSYLVGFFNSCFSPYKNIHTSCPASPSH